MLCIFLTFPLSINAQTTDTIPLTLQVGESYTSYAGAGNCIAATSYDDSYNFPEGIEFQTMGVTVGNFGFITVQYTIQVAPDQEPGIYLGEAVYTTYRALDVCSEKRLLFQITVIPAGKPEVDFSAVTTRILIGGNVQFINKSGNPVTEWLWRFGDGQTSTEFEPSHQYVSEGSFDVMLIATGPGGTDSLLRTGYIEVVPPGTAGVIAWSFSATGPILYSPALDAQNHVYFSSMDGYLYALDASGAEKWKFNTYSRPMTPAVGNSGTIYLPVGGANRVYAFHPDGRQKWMYQDTTGGSLNSELAIGPDESIFLSKEEGTVIKIDSSGTFQGSVHPLTTLKAMAIGADGTLYLAGDKDTGDPWNRKKGWLVAVNQDLSVKWEYDRQSFYRFSDIAITGSGVIYAMDFSKMDAISPMGEKLWNFPVENQVGFFNVNFAFDSAGNVYAGNQYGYLYAISASGDLLWKKYLGSGPFEFYRKAVASPLLAGDGRIYCCTKAGGFFCLGQDGEIEWQLSIIGDTLLQTAYIMVSGPAMDSEGMLYYGFDNGTLYAVTSGSNGLDNGQWSRFGQNNGNTFSFMDRFPYLYRPAGGSQFVSSSDTFTWSSVYRADEYEIQVSTRNDFSDIVFSGSTSQTGICVPGLANAIYYWRVRPILGSAEKATWSEVRRFTNVPAIPGKTILHSPRNNDWKVPVKTVFEWYQAENTTEYQLQIALLSDPPFRDLILDSCGIIDTFFIYSNLDYIKWHQWRVRGTFQNATGEWSETWDFKTLREIPDPPVLLSPRNDSTDTGLDILFSWEKTEGAVFYNLQLAYLPHFPYMPFTYYLDTTAYLVHGLHANETYYWRVNATSATGGKSEWSEVRSFTTGSSSSTEHALLPDVTVYPQPAGDKLYISGIEDGPAGYQVYSITGTLLLRHTGSIITEIDISSLEKGTYLLRITEGERNIIRKFVKF